MSPMFLRTWYQTSGTSDADVDPDQEGAVGPADNDVPAVHAFENNRYAPGASRGPSRR